MSKSAHPIELVILDLDGTVINPLQAKAISPGVSQAIADVQRAGIRLTIGTGRTLDLMRPYAQALNVSLPVVTTQGAVVADPVSGKIYAETLMPLDAARDVAAWVDQERKTTVFYFTDEYGHVTIFQNEMAGDDAFYDHVFGSPRLHQQPFSALLSAEDTAPPVKFITVNDATHEEDITPRLAELFPKLSITRTHEKLVEGTAKGINKGVGLLRLCEILNLDPQHVLAIGDNDNDIPMLEAAGFAVAMGNGSPGAKAAADWVAPTIDEDGAAIALKKMGSWS